MSRTPDQRTFSSETYDHYSFTTCYVSIGPADAEDFAFEKCTTSTDSTGATKATATFNKMPNGTFKITVFDQWNDIMLDGLVGTIVVNGNTIQEFPVTQWRTNLYTRTFVDTNGDGVSTHDYTGTPCTAPNTPAGCNSNYGNDTEPGLALVHTNIRYRDGSIGFLNNTDLNGYAAWNEVFPFMNWLVVEPSSERYKPTSIHTVYDAGGPVDCSKQAANATPPLPCTNIAANLASTAVRVALPSELRVPGAKYCDNADCPASAAELTAGHWSASGNGNSTGVIFPPQPWGNTQGWQGLLGQNSFMEFGLKSYVPGETGGIDGHVIYASTRPFDDPSMLLQLTWEPGIPHVKVNLYQKTVDANGNEQLQLVDTTMTTSWDDWAQGFRKDGSGNLLKDASGNYIPNINCPGQDSTSPFFATLKGSTQWLDTNSPKLPLSHDSQFKCYDGWSMLNQIQPAPYDGMYRFPSVTIDQRTGTPTGTNCTVCVTNPDSSDPYRYGGSTTSKPYMSGTQGFPMLPPGKYVVEVIVPPGYELVKEEDKNILMGDIFIAPVTQQFAGFGNVFIMPDQAAVNAYYNRYSPGGVNNTTNLGASPRADTVGNVDELWPCVGAERVVPDLMSLFPGAGQAAPFAGAKRRLCDRKEVDLKDQASAVAKFFIFSSAHIAGHFTGTITNDFASEFDPFSPQFGEKFGPPNLPVAMRDFNGNEVARVYSDQWGVYDGMYFSSWEVNPPNPTGYAPQMSIACMNDPGPVLDTRPACTAPNTPAGCSMTSGQMITDPSYNPAYSNFCYETPFMPGFTAYMDTPVIPTQSFADGYNLPDTEYPDGTPAIKQVVSSAAPGPWVHPANAGTLAKASFMISSVTRATNAGNSPTITSITAGTSSITGTTPIVCGTANGQCGNSNQNPRNNNLAQLIVTRINSSGSGYSASLNGAVVTITAPAGTFDTVNGTAITVNIASPPRLTALPNPTTLTGGVAPQSGAMTLTITALGDKFVQNPNFSGPNSTATPFNSKTITRHYGFGSRPASCPTTGACPNVTVGGVPMTNVTTWIDTTIAGTVNATGAGTSVPNCTVQQRNQPSAQCGELVITAANGKQSIDAITVTIGGSAPWIVTPNKVATNTGGNVTAPAGKSVKDYGQNFGRMFYSPLQVAIDSAAPGDLILVQPGVYRENLIMWKPVRLQGVGAGAVTINADAHPAGKMDEWRRQVNCVFGLTLDGAPNLGNANFAGLDPNNSLYSCPAEMHQRVDRIPFEAIVGWDASGNGNLAQVLQEPTLMGAYEGAGITVLGRGVRIPDASNDFWGMNATGGAGAFTDGSVWLTSSDCTVPTTNITNGRDYYTSNYYCNPARIDGVSVVNSSQGGGGIFIHGWAHHLDVGNTRVWGNHGTLAGAINLGNGEVPDAFVNDGVECGVNPPVMPCPPINGTALNAAIPFQFNTNVRIHHNMLYDNASIGDALFSGTPAGAGAITVSAGADGYQIDHNWIAGNLSTGDGGGLQHLGLSFNGRITNNYILFNQSTNPTLPTNGGGVVIEGANLDRTLNGQECGSLTDQDCPPGLGEGTGPGLVIDANLILGNSAESGSGGGLRIQQVNGSELVAFPADNRHWYDVTVTNNIIANNVAGYDGGGVSIQDALKVSFVNNTVASNDTTASAGVLFKTLGAIYSASPPPGCKPTTDPTQPQSPTCTIDNAQHGKQPAGLVTMAHTPNLVTAIAGLTSSLNCPSGFNYAGGIGTGGLVNGDCRTLSKPAMTNDLFWQNRSFQVDIFKKGTGNQSQQNLITLTPALNQSFTGQCATGAYYWDVGIRTDDLASGTVPTTTKLMLTTSILSNTTQGGQGVLGGPFIPGSPPLIAQFCNGARVPPENCTVAQQGQVTPASCFGYNAPPGSSETTGLTQVFTFGSIKPTATVDEGHNWLNLSYGPLTLNRSVVQSPNATSAPELMVAGKNLGGTGTTDNTLVGLSSGAYSISTTSAARNVGTNAGAPSTDFFGNRRQAQGTVDIGAVEFQPGQGTPLVLAP
jgi:hypothetical protein